MISQMLKEDYELLEKMVDELVERIRFTEGKYIATLKIYR